MSSDAFHLPAFLTSQTASVFPWDVVVLAIIAAALGFRLYRILGRRVGVQGVKQTVPRSAAPVGNTGRTMPPPLPEGAGAASGAEPPPARHEIPAPATRVGGVLIDIVKVRSGFNPQDFLKGVETAFRQIVTAFANGDRAVLTGAMTENAAQAYLSAIDAREAAGEKQRSDIRGVEKVALLNAEVVNENERSVARIEVEIVSRQVSLLTNSEGHPVIGTEAVTEFNDLWVFETVLGTDDTRWRLASSRPA
ncbi:mitochondrial import inner membrane translocase subunit Tim44 [Neokomagataea thailandica NBRC 106555]|uniref:Tim44 domain-containing protein n=2 Tax=Neokomagataea TaxID=1223423 RepID=A0A4Y6V969_9PROT|nr:MULTISPECIES: Tim44/TimA family putative adaptor protein [Neokomagataea]QDH25161.1 Tim44 domain-containing protein [Neokomagataea tanensis]GBR51960.1 mitochondrial import inner membrane translocase subunit Tim44 [Neokomagataea thailandica NBRC 106555]